MSQNTVFNVPRPRSIAAQLRTPTDASLASSSDLNDRDTIKALPHATWKGRRFVSDDLISKKGSRGRTTWIRNEGLFVREILHENTLGEAFWVCRRCDEQQNLSKLFNAVATTSAATHLRTKHRVLSTATDEASEASSITDDLLPPPKRHCSAPVAIPKSQVTKVEELAVGYIVNTDSPFTTFEDPYLKALLIELDSDLYSQVSWARSSQMRELGRVFAAKKALVKEEIQRALTKVHISFDLWTSPNRYAIIAVYAHFLSHSGQRTQYLLALRRQPGAHAGENIAPTLYNVAKDWEILSKLGVAVCDNATNNDTCLQHLFRLVSSDFTHSDVMDRRMRCYGHILNLVGRAFLHGIDNEAFEQESDALISTQQLREDLELWRTRGPVGKLRNVVKYIRSSPQRCERFLAISNEAAEDDVFTIFEESHQELKLMLSNDTRWNSTYLMIKRALLKRTQIDGFILDNKTIKEADQRLPDEDALDEEDWKLLAELKDVLEPLYMQTMRCQGWGNGDGHGRLWEVMTGMEYLIDRLEEWKKLYDEPTQKEIALTASQQPPCQRPPSSRPLRSSRYMPLSQGSAPPPPSITSIPPFIRSEYMPQDRIDRLRHKDFDSRGYFRLSVLNGWKILNKYYTKLGESPLYAAAVILHPGRGLRWLEKRWNTPEQREWLFEAKDGLYAYWSRWYAGAVATPPLSPPRGTFTVLSTASRGEDSEYHQWLNSRAIDVAADDSSELDQYFRQSIARPVDDPIQWWISNRSTFPTLSKLALDILAIPAMATDCERTFSLAKLTLTSQRLSMAPSRLEEVQCLKNWLRGGSVALGGQHFVRKERG